MVRTRGHGCVLGRAIEKVLGRREASDDDAPSGEGLLHLPVGSYNKSVLLRIFLQAQRN